jgi:hypothetical protein
MASTEHGVFFIVDNLQLNAMLKRSKNQANIAMLFIFNDLHVVGKPECKKC